jgi:hypothetical protein
VRHRANAKFWRFYQQLPADIQKLADKNFALLKQEPQHPSLHFKKVGRFWSARIGIHYRAVAVQAEAELVWFWIGRHDEYELIIGARH